MPFPASAVGLELSPASRRVSTRTILAYAASLGAAEPAFLDDAREGGLAALPFQCVSFEWPVLLSARAHMSGHLAEHEARRGVHAIQDSEFHRPIRPDDDLETRGQLVLARPLRAGVFTTHKLETIDRRTGETVVTSWSSSIYRDVALEGSTKILAEPPTAPVGLASDFDEAAATTTTIPIAREAPHVYSECADIWNPIHTERAVALAAGLPDIILHGTATWALAGLEILRAYVGGDVSQLKRFSGRFAGMVIPGETLVIRHAREASNPRVIRYDVRTSSGAAAITHGFALLAG